MHILEKVRNRIRRIHRSYRNRFVSRRYYAGVAKATYPCGICGSSSTLPFFDNDRYNMGVNTVSCARCGHVFINPRPTDDEIITFYRDHYRNYYESIRVPSLEYIQRGTFTERATFTVNNISSVMRRHALKIDSVLDIGCGHGSVLAALRDSRIGNSRQGIEPSTEFGSFARHYAGADVHIGTFASFLESNNPGDEKYDLIILSHVLEHLPYPARELRIINKLLRPNGLLYVEVPNVCADGARSLSSIHLGHLNMFYPETFQYCIKLAGFEIAHFQNEGIPGVCPSMGAVAIKPAGAVEEPASPVVAAEQIMLFKSGLVPANI